MATLDSGNLLDQNPLVPKASDGLKQAPPAPLMISEILSSLSHVLDLVEGQQRGHAVRTAFLAVRIARKLRLDDETCRETYYVAILKDAGSSDASARIHQMFGGDDLAANRASRMIDWTRTTDSVKFALRSLMQGTSPVQKLRHLPAIIGSPKTIMDRLTLARCTRAAEIARELGFTERVAQALECLDEHWDGHGSPQRLAGHSVPLLSRIVGLAQTLEAFVSALGIDAAYQMLDLRAGKWFQPEIVAAAYGIRSDYELWNLLERHQHNASIQLPVVHLHDEASQEDIDRICGAFARIVDAKSLYTADHSTRVARYAVQLGKHFGFDEQRLTDLRRAALLHDVGKLGVSNTILDKRGALTDEESDLIRKNSTNAQEALKRIRGFERVYQIASDRFGRRNEANLDSQILFAADAYDSLTADRAYREALPKEKALEILKSQTGKEVVAALSSVHAD
jgi:HD-GYP domain-containing protein (c-di-GMP phosphodiesterase class II)